MAAYLNQFSPAELAYLHTSLSLRPPVRPDGRSATQFRPLTAETGVLPGTNGSARVCFADGTEAVVGVKAEIEKTELLRGAATESSSGVDVDDDNGTGDDDAERGHRDDQLLPARRDWLELSIEVAGQRDDDAATIFLAEMLREAIVVDDQLVAGLRLSRRFHWRIYIDIILISPPLSYPLPLLSLTTHLALLATRTPRLKSEGDEDPMFDDDWEASRFLYPPQGAAAASRPPITLLVIAVGKNIIFDPAKEELAVADTVLAVSVSEVRPELNKDQMDVDSRSRKLRLVSVRTIDPPARLTPPGVPDSANVATNGTAPALGQESGGGQAEEGVWKAPLGGVKYGVLIGIIDSVLERGGVAHEVLDGLEAIDIA